MILINSLYGDVSFKSKIILSGNLITGKKLELKGNIFYGGSRSYPKYHGEYIVIPQTYSQMLNTNNKIMEDDVTVTEIPYDEVSNEYGTSVIIAS